MSDKPQEILVSKSQLLAPERNETALQEFARSVAYSGIQSPMKALAQPIDRALGTRLEEKVSFIDAPAPAEFNSSRFWTQQTGNAVGMLGTFFLASKAVGRFTRAGLNEAQLADNIASRGALGLTLKEAALTGFVHDAFLRPTESKDHRSLLEARLASGANGALVMTVLTASTRGMKYAGEIGSLERATVQEHSRLLAAVPDGLRRGVISPLLKNDIFTGVTSGLLAGGLAVNGESLMRDRKLASFSDTVKGAYTMSLLAGGFGAFHHFCGPRPAGPLAEVPTKSVTEAPTKPVAEAPAKPVAEAPAKPVVEAPTKQVETSTQARLETFDMPEPGMEVQASSRLDSTKLTEAKSSTEKIPELKKDGVDRAGNESQFIDEMIELRERPVQVQKIKGSDVEIIVPQEYAQRLAEVRELRKIAEQNTERLSAEQQVRIEAARDRLAEHPLANRALPEEVAAVLEQSPDLSLFKKVFLLDEANPMDNYWQRIHTSDFQSRAQATPDGTLSLYSLERPGSSQRYASVNEQVRHEWAHLLKWSNRADGSLFASAMKLEPGVKAREPYAPANVDEAFATHLGENLLHPDGVQFLAAARRNPIASSLAFDMLCARVEPSRMPEWLKSRQAEINQHIRPLAIEQLKASMGSQPTAEAAALLLRLGGENALAGLTGARAIDLTGLKLGDNALSAAATNSGITSVRLNYAQFAESSLSLLSNLQLRNLELAGTCISDASIPTLSAMKTLKTLDINGTRISFSGYVQLRGNLPDAQIKR